MVVMLFRLIAMYMSPHIQHVWNSCSGNPAAVCLLEEDVPDQLKQAHYQTVFTKSLNSENLMMLSTKEMNDIIDRRLLLR